MNHEIPDRTGAVRLSPGNEEYESEDRPHA